MGIPFHLAFTRPVTQLSLRRRDEGVPRGPGGPPYLSIEIYYECLENACMLALPLDSPI